MPLPDVHRQNPYTVSLPISAGWRLLGAGLLCAILLYLVVFWQPTAPIVTPPEPPLVAVPELDQKLLALAKDGAREERLFLEPEPLSHLLEQALNVSPEAARALGMPKQMVPVAELQQAPAQWRGRWLFYRGTVENLEGPRPGHPLPGYGVYEATLRLDDGNAVLFAFSKPVDAAVRVGGIARAAGYMLKLRDVAHPRELRSAPLLVGSELVEDYADWAPQRALDQERLAAIDDVQRDGEHLEPKAAAWRTLDEDQSVPLWHIGAYARDASPADAAYWRTIQALNAQEVWDAFKHDAVARGTPMRVLGTLAMVRTKAARPNPAGITDWTEAWLQVRDLGGKTVPVWVPKAVTTPLGASLEVRGYYFRRFAYEGLQGQQFWTPLFVAADLDPFVFDTRHDMLVVTSIAGGAALLFILLAIWSQRRERVRADASEDALVARRRRRRQKLAPAGKSP